jgi:hypothetical protein
MHGEYNVKKIDGKMFVALDKTMLTEWAETESLTTVA